MSAENFTAVLYVTVVCLELTEKFKANYSDHLTT